MHASLYHGTGTLRGLFPAFPVFPDSLLVCSCRAAEQVSTVVEEGKMFAKTASGLVEVVSVSSAELARLPYDLAEGVYMVGTGSTGAAAALGVSGEPGHALTALRRLQGQVAPFVARLIGGFVGGWPHLALLVSGHASAGTQIAGFVPHVCRLISAALGVSGERHAVTWHVDSLGLGFVCGFCSPQECRTVQLSVFHDGVDRVDRAGRVLRVFTRQEAKFKVLPD